jgi:hypothetical protein
VLTWKMGLDRAESAVYQHKQKVSSALNEIPRESSPKKA